MKNHKLFLTRSLKSIASLAGSAARFGLPRSVAAGRQPGAINIVAYHRVVEDIAQAERDSFHGLVVSQETFRRHCEMLKTSFDVVSLETAAYFLDGTRRLQKPLAVITFDDGYEDFYTAAFPVLRELALPATNFLPTEFIGSGKILAHDRIFYLLKIAANSKISIRPALADLEKAGKVSPEAIYESLVFLPHEKREKIIAALEELIFGGETPVYPREFCLLDWEQVEEMNRKGVDFGFHTANHVILPLETDAAFESEILNGKRELENRLNRKVVSFAYPNGEFNTSVRRKVEEAGFKIAVTTERKINLPGSQTDALTLGRISLCEESTRGIKGEYSPAIAKLRLCA